jgi:hypothetical protein
MADKPLARFSLIHRTAGRVNSTKFAGQKPMASCDSQERFWSVGAWAIGPGPSGFPRRFLVGNLVNRGNRPAPAAKHKLWTIE